MNLRRPLHGSGMHLIIAFTKWADPEFHNEESPIKIVSGGSAVNLIRSTLPSMDPSSDHSNELSDEPDEGKCSESILWKQNSELVCFVTAQIRN